jgi:hypothetical protein
MVNKRQFLINLGLGLLFSFSIFLYCETIITFAQAENKMDFLKFYMSAKYSLEGKDIYTSIPMTTLKNPMAKMIPKMKEKKGKTSEPTRTTVHPNLNPPFETLLLAPVGLISYEKAYLIFSILSLALGLIAAIVISNEVINTRHDLSALLTIMIVILLYFPTWINIVYGQFSLILLFLITLAWIAAKKGGDCLCGLSLGLAMSLKLFVGLFFLFFLVRRRWRLLLWFFATFVLLSLLPLLVYGIGTYKNYLKILSEITWYAASWNASFLGFFTRIFGGSENVPLVNYPTVARVLTSLCSLIFVLWLTWLAWPQAQESRSDYFDLSFSLCIVGMLLISPLGWMYYFPILIIPASVVWRLARESDHRIRYQSLIVLAWLLGTVPHLLIPSAEMNTFRIWFTWAGCYFYALLLFSFIISSLAQRLNKLAHPGGMGLSGPTKS